MLLDYIGFHLLMKRILAYHGLEEFYREQTPSPDLNTVDLSSADYSIVSVEEPHNPDTREKVKLLSLGKNNT